MRAEILRARRSSAVAFWLSLALAFVPPPALASGYPTSAAEARRIRESLEKDVAEERAKPNPAQSLTEAREQYVALLGDIEALHTRAEQLSLEQAGRAGREAAARVALSKTVPPRAFRGTPSTEQLTMLSGNVQDLRAKLEALRARRGALEAERDTGLKAERDRATARRNELAAQLAAFQADLPRLRSEAATLADQQAVEVRFHVLDLGLEYAGRWLDLLARRADDLSAQIAVADLETEVANKAVERGNAELRSAWTAEREGLGKVQKEAEALHRAATEDVQQALGDWERLLQQWRADTLAVEARTAGRKRELAAVQSSGLRSDAIETAKARFDETRDRFTKSRAVGIDTLPLTRRGLERVDRDRMTYLAGNEVNRWRSARTDAVAALEEAENQLLDLDDRWRLVVAEAREAWIAASAGSDLEQRWESEELPIWEDEARHRRESLRGLGDSLRALADEYQARLERAATLSNMLDVEARWLERRALLTRIHLPDPARAVRQAWIDWGVWREGGGRVRWPIVGGLLALVAFWRIMIGRLRALSAGWLSSDEASDKSRRTARRAWRAIAVRASWVPLAPLLGWLAASVIDADPAQAQALVESGWIGAGVLGIYALLRGLHSVLDDPRMTRRFRRIAACAALVLMVVGLPLHYLGRISYEVCNPDLMVLLGITVRSALAIVISAALISRAPLLDLLPMAAADQVRARHRPVRIALMMALAATVAADWLGYVQLASWLFTAAFGGVLVLGLGIAGARSALQALSRGSDAATLTDILAEERRAYLLHQARTGVVLVTVAVTTWGLLLALRVTPADLQAAAARQTWPFRSEGSSGLTLGALFVASLFLTFTVVLARALRGALDNFVLAWAGVERDLRYSISTVIHYVILLVGSAKALGRLGVDLKDLQWLLAAAGVGIGFGLQEIISNFVSGIIILFERPLKIGDVVEIEGHPGEVVDVSIRSTTVRTQDNKFVLVPNKEIITQRLTNFTGSDPKLRIEVPVGVAYGTDTGLVRETLLEVARRHGRVYKRPAPDVLFRAHGASSLDFVVRAWVHVKDRDELASDLRLAIDAAFRRLGIEIPYPQNVVHLVPAPGAERVEGRGDDADLEDRPANPRQLV